MDSTRELIRDFALAFERPVNDRFQHDISVEDRILLGSILLEEVVEYITQGLGLEIVSRYDLVADDTDSTLKVAHLNSRPIDPVLIIDGLSDVNVVAHFNAHWHGFDLDASTAEANDSNMSKLDDYGKPIINKCVIDPEHHNCLVSSDDCDFIDPTKPKGKILKGPNFRQPNFAQFIRG